MLWLPLALAGWEHCLEFVDLIFILQTAIVDGVVFSRFFACVLLYGLTSCLEPFTYHKSSVLNRIIAALIIPNILFCVVLNTELHELKYAFFVIHGLLRTDGFAQLMLQQEPPNRMYTNQLVLQVIRIYGYVAAIMVVFIFWAHPIFVQPLMIALHGIPALVGVIMLFGRRWILNADPTYLSMKIFSAGPELKPTELMMSAFGLTEATFAVYYGLTVNFIVVVVGEDPLLLIICMCIGALGTPIVAVVAVSRPQHKHTHDKWPTVLTGNVILLLAFSCSQVFSQIALLFTVDTQARVLGTAFAISLASIFTFLSAPFVIAGTMPFLRSIFKAEKETRQLDFDRAALPLMIENIKFQRFGQLVGCVIAAISYPTYYISPYFAFFAYFGWALISYEAQHKRATQTIAQASFIQQQQFTID